MRLRTRLFLAFVTLSVIPVMLVVPLLLRDLRRTLSTEMQSRVAAGTSASRAELSRMTAQVKRSLDDLVSSAGMEAIAREVHSQNATATLSTAAEELMKSHRLTVLSVFDA